MGRQAPETRSSSNRIRLWKSPTLYYNEAEQEIVSGEKRGKVISMIGSIICVN